MTESAGLWLDHRRAVIVFVSDAGEKTKIIRSNVEKHPGRIDGVRSTAPTEDRFIPADDRQQSSFTSHLNGYYDKIIEALHHIKSILIFGPGEAAGELKKRIESSKSNKSNIEIEVMDKMTDREISTKVRKRFPVDGIL
jgi:hypothetical protein